MNSQGGKASTNASRMSKRTNGQTSAQSKVQNNGNSSKNEARQKGAPPRQRRRNRGGQNLSNTYNGAGRLGLGSANMSRTKKTHLLDEDEYITDVNGSVAFATNQFSINPGQSSTFPWGNKIASLYEKYEFTYLEFYYRREVSEFSTNGQAGKVMLSCDYDASDGPPTSKQQVLDTEPHVDGMPCTPNISLIIDCRQLRRQDGCYVRPGVQPANTDIKTYDAGNLFISTFGNTNATVIGELRVRYKCLLSVPVLESGSSQSGQAGSYLTITSALAGEVSAATTVAAPLFANSTTPIVVANGIGAVVATSGLITLLAGSYLIESNCISWSLTVSVTAGHLLVCNQITPGTGDVNASSILGAEAAAGVNDTLGHLPWLMSSDPFIWNTSIQGTTICAQADITFAGGGTALNQAYLKITQL
jgi:hypothetical protein